MNVGDDNRDGRECEQARRLDARARRQRRRSQRRAERQRNRNMLATDKLLRDCPALHEQFLADASRLLDAEAAKLERRWADLMRRWRLSRLTLLDGAVRVRARPRP